MIQTTHTHTLCSTDTSPNTLYMTQRNHTSSSSTPLTASLSIFYRNALRIIKVTVVKPTHMQSELTNIMRTRFMLRWYEVIIAPVQWGAFRCSCPGSDSVSLQMSVASHHTLLLTVSALEDSHYTTTEEKLLVLGSYTVVTKRVARLFIGRCTYKLYFV